MKLINWNDRAGTYVFDDRVFALTSERHLWEVAPPAEEAYVVELEHRTPETELLAWSVSALEAAGARATDAVEIARALVDMDLRGIKSHGTHQMRRYVDELRSGTINPSPVPRAVKETANR